MPRRDNHDLARLLATKAAGDEAALDGLLGNPDVPDEVLGFHAQQAVEKLIKAVLADSGAPPPRSHDIAYLLTVLEDRGIAPPPGARELEALSPWAAEFRYEDTLGKTLDRESIRARVGSVRRWADEIIQR